MNQAANGDYTGDVLAVLDETSPMIGAGVYYVITTAIIINPAMVAADLGSFFDGTPNRKKPFHWHKEGETTKRRMVDLIIANDVTATTLYRSVGRKDQKEARVELLGEHARQAEQAGVTHLIMEASDRRMNTLDLDTVALTFPGGQKPYRYEHRRKNEQTLWVADAFCGAVSDFFRNTDPSWYAELDEAGLLEMSYR